MYILTVLINAFKVFKKTKKMINKRQLKKKILKKNSPHTFNHLQYLTNLKQKN
jgi:hypothetical protein